MEIVNFAHGEFLMLAMFATFWAWALAKLDPLTSLPITVGLLFLLGFAVYHGLIRWILGAPMLAQIFATFGLAIFLRAAAQALWGVDFKLVKNPLVDGRLAVGGLFIGVPQLAASVGALAAFGFLYWFITRTETGLALQATAQDRQAASLMGIDTQRMFALGWGIGAACVGAAGALLAMFFYIFPDVGATFALLAYVFLSWGGLDTLMAAGQVAKGIRNKTLTDDDARRFMEANVNFIEKASDSEQDKAVLGVMKKFMRLSDSGFTEEEQRELSGDILDLLERSDLSDEDRDKLQDLRRRIQSPGPGKDPTNQSFIQNVKDLVTGGTGESPDAALAEAARGPEPARYVPVPLSEAKDHVGSSVLVTNHDGLSQQCALVGVSGTTLHFEKQIPGGSMSFEIPSSEIRSLQVLAEF